MPPPPWPPTLSTPRLTLHLLPATPLAPALLAALHAHRADPAVARWSRRGTPDASLAQTHEWLDGVAAAGAAVYLVFLRAAEPRAEPASASASESATETERGREEAARFIGTVGTMSAALEPEVAYAVSPAQWGRGYATEALRALVGVLEGAAVAKVDVTNGGSRRVLGKVGFGMWRVSEEEGWRGGKGGEVWRWEGGMRG